MTNQDENKAPSRVSIIAAIQKPINFFALIVLVVEVILGITANFSQGTDRTFLVIGMLILIFTLVFIVAGFAFFRPEALSGRRPINKTKQRELEDLNLPSVCVIKKPSLLMAAAQQPFLSFLENDTKIIEGLFPRRQIKISKDMSSSQLRDILTDGNYDIVHLTVYVDKDGSLIFGENDRMSPEAFSKLIEISHTTLVVLAVCDSLILASKIARTTNMIAATESIADKDLLEWEHMFYKLLSRGQSLSRSYEMARATTNVQMLLLMKKDFVIESDST